MELSYFSQTGEVVTLSKHAAALLICDSREISASLFDVTNLYLQGEKIRKVILTKTNSSFVRLPKVEQKFFNHQVALRVAKGAKTNF